MPLQSLIWTVLPNGAGADRRSLRISVLVSPRLEPQTATQTLAAFPDFVAWPRTLRNATFTLQVGADRIVLGAANVDATIGVPDEATWIALFSATTFVRPWTMPDHRADTIVSYDATAMHDLVSRVYAKLTVAAGNNLPSMQELTTDSTLATLIAQVADIDRDCFDEVKKERDIGKLLQQYVDGFKKYGGTPVGAFQMFHTPPNAVTTQTVTPRHDERLKVSWQRHKRGVFDAAKAVREFDFHQLVSSMNGYPTLLRRLGLVLDFTIPGDRVPPSANVALSVTVTFKSAATPDALAPRVTSRSASPQTFARRSDSTFAAASRPGAEKEDFVVSDGMLKLAPDQFSLLQADVDGAGHKLINFARTLSHHVRPERQLDPTTRLPRRAGAPAVRNAGLMLVHQKRAKGLEHAIGRGQVLNDRVSNLFGGRSSGATSGAVALYAEDITRGWRFDIWDKRSGAWRSLCERIARYDIDKGAIVIADVIEEATVRLATTSSTDGNNSGVMFLHEAVTVWNGWSLAAQQPGMAISPDDTKLRDAATDVPEGVRMRTSFVARPRSLPKLRYGHEYAIRARAVDIAGNSLPPTADHYSGDAEATQNATPYLRFAPVQPPTLALVGTRAGARTPLEGESMGLMAIRSFNDVHDDRTLSSQEAQRWAVAPRTSQREAELHGVLDGAAWGTAEQFALLAERDHEIATYDVLRDVAAPAQPERGLVAPGLPPSAPPARSDDREKTTSTSYAVLPEGASLLPYLPDPMATDIVARLFNHPLMADGASIPIPLYRQGGKWPDAAPLRIHMYEGSDLNVDVPRFDADTHTLLLPTPKGTRATLRLSATLDDSRLPLMGVWNWVPPADRTNALERQAKAGRLWPLTPWRELSIVHAVQRPLLPPRIVALEVERAPGATLVVPTVYATVDRNTTDKVELRASWHDARDIAGTVSPVDQPKRAIPISIKITDPHGYAGLLEHIVPDASNQSNIAFGNVKPDATTEAALIDPKVHDFGDTRYRRVEYQLVATSRFREFMPASVLNDGAPSGTAVRGAPAPTPTRASDAPLRLEGPVTTAWVRSSAAPPMPEVLYVVPTFGWTRGLDASGQRVSWRRGGGLRVWLDRPWNATGYGEMLAVVIPRAGTLFEPNDEPFANTLTQWGNDPIWKTPFVGGVAPVAGNFPRRRVAPDVSGAWLPPGAPTAEATQPPGGFVTTNLGYPALPQFTQRGRVDVVPHDVHWDAERRLWYSDIEITHGSAYFPFVRMALARYQPSSLPEQYLSNIVMADFCALTPTRWLTVSGANPTHRSVRVFGVAPEQSSGYAEAYAARSESIVNGKVVPHLPIEIAKSNIIEVWVEKLTPAQGEDFGWHQVAAGVESAWREDSTAGRTTVAAKGPVSAATTFGSSATSGSTSSGAAERTRADTMLAERDYELMLRESRIDSAHEMPSMWAGSIALPSAPSASDRYRVVVAEYEEYLADGADPYQQPFGATARRLVFVEHVELT